MPSLENFSFLKKIKLGDFYLLKEIECDECMLNGKILNCCLFTNGNIELRNCSRLNEYSKWYIRRRKKERK